MRSFRRSPSAAPMPAPPPPAPVAQPAMPNPYLRNLPQPTQVAQPVGLDQQRVQQPQPMGLQQRLMQQAQPNLSGAIGQLRAGDNVAAQNTMRQIVGLPPLPAAPQMANPSLADAIALGKTGDQAGMQRMMQQIVGLPPSGAPQQPGRQQIVGPGLTPEGNLFNPMQQAPAIPLGMQVQQPYMPQRMTMDMPQTNQPMMELPTQPMDDGSIMGRATNMMSRAGVFGNPQPIGPQKMAGGYDPIAAERDYYSRMAAQRQQSPTPPRDPFTVNLQDLYGAVAQQQTGMQQPASPAANMMSNAGFGPQVSAAFGSNMQPQQPNSLGQQFGQAQNPFARPMQQQAFGQSSMPQGIGQSLQQSSGQTQQPSNIMSSKFGSAFGGGTQPQQPGMQQNNPMQKAGGSTGRPGLF